MGSNATTLFMSVATLTAQAMKAAYTIERAWKPSKSRSEAMHPGSWQAMQGDEDDGFRVLAGYIFGGNAGEKIAMTAPFSRAWRASRMAFMMPAQYALEDLPEPQDQRVAFRQEPAYTPP